MEFAILVNNVYILCYYIYKLLNIIYKLSFLTTYIINKLLLRLKFGPNKFEYKSISLYSKKGFIANLGLKFGIFRTGRKINYKNLTI